MNESLVAHISYNNKIFEIEGLSSDPITQFHVKRNEFYEISALTRLKAVIHKYTGRFKCDYIIDAGANIGNHTLFFAYNHPDLEVVSFEMNPLTYRFLSRNVKTSTLPNIELYNLGVSSYLGRCGVRQNSSNPLGGAQLDFSAGNSGDVEIVTIDHWLRTNSRFGAKRCCLLKLDVEGQELEALKGSAQFLKNNMPLIYSELKEVDEFKQFSSMLFDLGYEIAYAEDDALPNFLFIDSSKLNDIFTKDEQVEIKNKLCSRVVDAWQLHRKIRSFVKQ